MNENIEFWVQNTITKQNDKAIIDDNKDDE